MPLPSPGGPDEGECMSNEAVAAVELGWTPEWRDVDLLDLTADMALVLEVPRGQDQARALDDIATGEVVRQRRQELGAAMAFNPVGHAVLKIGCEHRLQQRRIAAGLVVDHGPAGQE